MFCTRLLAGDHLELEPRYLLTIVASAIAPALLYSNTSLYFCKQPRTIYSMSKNYGLISDSSVCTKVSMSSGSANFHQAVCGAASFNNQRCPILGVARV